MAERFRTLSAVMLMLIRKVNGEEEILLQKRKNTGYYELYERKRLAFYRILTKVPLIKMVLLYNRKL